MGIETAIIGAIIGIAGGFMQASAMRKSAKAQKRAAQIASNKEASNRISEIRKANKERRIKVAKMQSMADAQGVGVSSGLAGGQGAAASNLSNAIGQSAGNQKANVAISHYNQKAANYESRAGTIGAMTGAFQQLFKAF